MFTLSSQGAVGARVSSLHKTQCEGCGACSRDAQYSFTSDNSEAMSTASLPWSDAGREVPDDGELVGVGAAGVGGVAVHAGETDASPRVARARGAKRMTGWFSAFRPG